VREILTNTSNGDRTWQENEQMSFLVALISRISGRKADQADFFAQRLQTMTNVRPRRRAHAAPVLFRRAGHA
jgi:hypothetical protein